jgi:hypothetical protein
MIDKQSVAVLRSHVACIRCGGIVIWFFVDRPDCLLPYLYLHAMRILTLLVVMVIVSFASLPVVDAQEFKDETAIWKALSNSVRAEDFKLYLEVFPNGVYADEARLRLNAIKRREQTVQHLSDADGLTQTCRSHLEASRLTKGTLGNALDCYRQVLSTSPGNQQALDGISRIAEKYAGLAITALAEMQMDRLDEYIADIRSIEATGRLASDLAELRDMVAFVKVQRELDSRKAPEIGGIWKSGGISEGTKENWVDFDIFKRTDELWWLKYTVVYMDKKRLRRSGEAELRWEPRANQFTFTGRDNNCMSVAKSRYECLSLKLEAGTGNLVLAYRHDNSGNVSSMTLRRDVGN